MGQQPAMSAPPQKGQGRSSAYHHMALAEIRNSLLPFAAPSETGSSLSSVSTASVSSSHSSVSNGLSDKDLLRQHMGYAEELPPAVRLMKGRGVDAPGLGEYRLHDSVGLNGYTKLPAQVVVVGAKVMRKPSLEKEALRGSPQSVPDSGAGSSRSASPRPATENSVLGGPPPPGARNSSDELPPPPPPPRSAHTPPPPPPPHSSYRLKRMGPSAPSQRPSPTSRPMVVDNNPQVQQQLQAMAVLSLGEPPPPYHFVPPPAPPNYGVQPRASPTHQPDYSRKSPSSSGVYSASGSLGSPSPVLTPPHVPSHAPPLVRQAKTLPPVIMHSVKSMQVPKPVLQTAIAPTAPPSPPPPPYQASVAAKSVAPNVGVKGVASSVVSKNVTPSVPTTEPPSYASTMQAFAAAQAPARPMPTGDQSALVSTVEISLNKHHLPYHQPPPPPPHHQQRKYTPTPKEGEAAASSKTNGVDSGGSPRPGKIDHQSPIPERKHVSKEKEEERRDCKVRNYSPQAFKFFMEQHVENVLKSHRQRIFRRMQLENEMSKIGLSEEAQAQMRKMLSQKESNYIRLKRAKMDKSMFVRLKHIGVGAFGEVTLVRKIDTNHLYAMKTLRKTDVLKRNQVAHVKAERDILAEADNEWVVKLYYSFQDKDNLYFVMDYIPGGDLMSLLIKLGIFEEPLARFYIAELSCAVESVHRMGFIHRDIKPDNILIDRDGHIKLTDFGLCTGFRWTHNSKYYQRNGEHCREDSMEVGEDWGPQGECQCDGGGMKPLERRRRREHQRCLAHSLVGTPNYIAPEVLLRTGYTQLCDWWSVGVILYEMLVGSPPFLAKSPAETQNKVINWETTLQIPKEANLTPEASDLILKLCCGADRRLGKNAAEVKDHSFFRGIDFLRGVRRLTPPHIPRIRHSTDTSNFDPIDPDKLRGPSSDGASSTGDEPPKPPFHGFFEFTFRRFFDDGGAIPYPSKISLDDTETHGAVYV